MTEPLSPQFEGVLLHDILPAESRIVPPKSVFHLDDAYPGFVRIAIKPDSDGLFDAEDIRNSYPDRDMRVVPIPPDSKWVKRLSEATRTNSDKPTPVLATHTEIHKQLRDGFGLTPVQDYLVMSVMRRAGENTVLPNPEKYLLSIDQHNFHDIAMDMLRKLADPDVGAILMHSQDVAHYRQQLTFENSGVSQLIKQIVTNAQLQQEDTLELRTIALRKENYEFITRLNDCYRQSAPGFAQKARKNGADEDRGMVG